MNTILRRTSLSLFPHWGCCWSHSGGLLQKAAPHCVLSLSSVGMLWFQLFLISACIRQKLCWLWNIQQFQCYLKLPLLDQHSSFSLDLNKFWGHISLFIFERSKFVCCFCFWRYHEPSCCCSLRVWISHSECKPQFVTASMQQESQDPVVL